jgi:hypothetical protein
LISMGSLKGPVAQKDRGGIHPVRLNASFARKRP